MTKNITINNGGRYDDQSYTDERHYHYGEADEKHESKETVKDEGAAMLRARLRFVEALLEGCGISTRNTDRIKLCRLMAFATGTTDGYVKKLFTERHVEVSDGKAKADIERLKEMLSETDIKISI